jgi:pyruvate formate-lyase activating enzyme-like uncharacterized protein
MVVPVHQRPVQLPLFLLPSPQDDISVPTTNRLPFAKPADYTAYVARCGFQGVSISGGEPLMTPDRTLRFLEALNHFDHRPRHVWMYTNGTLLSADLVRRLAHAGLNEIRFDLSAVDYHLENLRLAVGRIPVVTVEIPAIPEDRERLERLLPVLKDAGIDHLNLHQLRLTPHHRTKLTQRKYTYLHGEKVTVLESELTALALMQQVVERGIQLAVSYFEAMLCPHISYHRAFKTVRLNREKEIFIEKQPVGRQMILDDDQRRRFVSMVLDPREPIHPAGDPTATGFMNHEFISPGLQDYF